MKRLVLMRHAKAEADSPTGRDFDRPLTELGRRDSALIGKELRGLGMDFDLLLASPAKRAAGTVTGAGLPPARFDERIYNASASELLRLIQKVEDSVHALMLVGHNPGFAQLAGQLTGGEVDHMPTGSLAEIELPGDGWSEVGQAGGRLVRFLKPAQLA